MKNPSPCFVRHDTDPTEGESVVTTIFEHPDGTVDVVEARLNGWDVYPNGAWVPHPICALPPGSTVLKRLIRRRDPVTGVCEPRIWPLLSPYVQQGRPVGRAQMLYPSAVEVAERALEGWAPEEVALFREVQGTLLLGGSPDQPYPPLEATK